MQIFLTIIAVVVIFSLLVLVHEWGHFFAAKRAGVKVLEFGFGFPPRLFSKKHGETVYSVNAIPFGGFVKLYGEDSSDPAAQKSRRSFIKQTPWTRTKIIVAGVFMNFLLAYVLLFGGFLFGIQPLILNENDLFSYLGQGKVEANPGVFVKEVKPGSVAQNAGLAAESRILTLNQKPVTSIEQVRSLENPAKDLDVQFQAMGANNAHLPVPPEGKNSGLTLYPVTYFPHPVVSSVDKGSMFADAGLQKNDVLLSLNGRPVYTPIEALSVFSSVQNVTGEILRGGKTQPFSLSFSGPRVILVDVFSGSQAEKSGFQSGDLLLAIGDTPVTSPEQAQVLIKESKGNAAKYKVQRGDKELTIEAKTDEKNVLGISLSALTAPIGTGLLLHQGSVLTSLTKIHNVRLGFFDAAGTAWTEMWRLSKLTVVSFGKTLKNIFTRFEVPQDIGGPVQIAYYTHTFVQEGFFALLRFTAILSLSLAVINILPIPALDGGRFLFIVIESIFKKRVNARFEYLVHSIGFVLLMVLILMVTYNDLIKLF